MNRKKELCRNFQRGSCQYGDRCKFLHTTQEQPRPGSFGFGVQSASPFLNASQQNQQQKLNPFGFGVQASPHSSGSLPPSQNQPFVNKWTRSNAVTASTKPSSKQGDGVHKCTDPESCRRQIIEDLDHERPLWKLTCYGHNRGKPCDVLGDVSYEELRAAAYEDARKGLSLQSIVERERNLVNAKLMEFDKLRQKPELLAKTPSSVVNQSHVTASAFGFGQRGASANTSPMARPVSQGSSIFGQTNGFMVQNQSSGMFGMKSEASGMTFGASLSSQQVHQSSTSPAFCMDGLKNVQAVSGNIFGQQFTSGLLMVGKEEISAEDCAIWLKGEWEIGEIPEEEPPAQFCL